MSVDPTDLGAAVCRALMREMDDKPIALELRDPRTLGRSVYEETGGMDGTVFMQWCVILMPLPDVVGVRAHLKFWGMGVWDRAELTDGTNPGNLFVPYPDDPAQIAGPDYEAALRAAVVTALSAVQAGRAQLAATS
jgi:hypothetical protein